MSELVITAAGFEIQPLVGLRNGPAVLRWAYDKIIAPTTTEIVSVLGQFTQRLRRSEPTWARVTEEVNMRLGKRRDSVYGAENVLLCADERTVRHVRNWQQRPNLHRPQRCEPTASAPSAAVPAGLIDLPAKIVRIKHMLSKWRNVPSVKRTVYAVHVAQRRAAHAIALSVTINMMVRASVAALIVSLTDGALPAGVSLRLRIGFDARRVA